MLFLLINLSIVSVPFKLKKQIWVDAIVCPFGQGWILLCVMLAKYAYSSHSTNKHILQNASSIPLWYYVCHQGVMLKIYRYENYVQYETAWRRFKYDEKKFQYCQYYYHILTVNFNLSLQYGLHNLRTGELPSKLLYINLSSVFP